MQEIFTRVPVYSVPCNLNQAQKYCEKLRDQVKQKEGCNRHNKVFPGLVTYIGRTHEEALAKKSALDEKLPVEYALKRMSFFFQQEG